MLAGQHGMPVACLEWHAKCVTSARLHAPHAALAQTPMDYRRIGGGASASAEPGGGGPVGASILPKGCRPVRGLCSLPSAPEFARERDAGSGSWGAAAAAACRCCCPGDGNGECSLAPDPFSIAEEARVPPASAKDVPERCMFGSRCMECLHAAPAPGLAIAKEPLPEDQALFCLPREDDTPWLSWLLCPTAPEPGLLDLCVPGADDGALANREEPLAPEGSLMVELCTKRTSNG